MFNIKTQQQIEKLSQEISNLSSNFSTIKDSVYFNITLLWSILAFVIAAIGVALFITARAWVNNRVDNEIEKIRGDIKEKVIQYNEVPFVLMMGWKVKETLTYSFDYLDNVWVHGLIEGGIYADGTVIGYIPSNIKSSEDKSFGVLYQTNNGWFPCVLKINTKGEMILDGCRGDTVLISNVFYKQKFRK